MDIKLKNKLPKPVKVILIYVIGVLLCFALYYFIDEILNGSFVNWFEENYMIMEYKYIEEAGNNGLVREPNYAKIKVFLLWAFVVGVIIWISVVLLVAHLHSKTKVMLCNTKIFDKHFRAAVTVPAPLTNTRMASLFAVPCLSIWTVPKLSAAKL